ncbi:MAG: metallophosphoesterase family protein [Planctomycetota bacterium]|nr:metallophosphoesterase family protein [Planctomycetota bacterium]
MELPLTAIISDLHANRPALRMALADARERGARRFWCLGDMVGYGAEPRECLDLVMAVCTPTARDPEPLAGSEPLLPGLALRGNHEEALFDSAAGFNPIARQAIEWTQDQLGAGGDRQRSMAYWDFLDGLRPEHLDEVAHLVHASPRDPLREYILPRDVHDAPKMRANFAAMQRDVCFLGHSHVPAVYYEDGRFFRPTKTEGPYDLAFGPGARCIVNVGSVGQPRDGDARLSYALFDGLTVTFVRLDYDHAAAAAAIRAVPSLPERLASRLFEGR